MEKYERKCPVCGKVFVFYEKTVYRRGEKIFCGWNCLVKYDKSKQKTVLALGKDGKVVKRFDSANDAGDYFGIDPIWIRRCCAGRQKTAGGRRFIYEGG